MLPIFVPTEELQNFLIAKGEAICDLLRATALDLEWWARPAARDLFRAANYVKAQRDDWFAQTDAERWAAAVYGTEATQRARWADQF